MLLKALENEELPESQALAIYRKNFDELITEPCIRNLSQNNVKNRDLPCKIRKLNGKFRAILDEPENLSTEPEQKKLSGIKNTEFNYEQEIDYES